MVPDDADGAEVTFEATVIAVDGSAVTVGIEAVCDGVKVLGAARAEVDLEAARSVERDRPGDSASRSRTHTTLRVGGPARRMIVAETEAELVDAVRAARRRRGAGADPGRRLEPAGRRRRLRRHRGQDRHRGASTEDVEACSGAVITVAAGEPWDPLVAYAVDREWSGLEALSGIPGLVGATPIQNVGAYGAEVSQLITTVRTFDRADRSASGPSSRPSADSAIAARGSSTRRPASQPAAT